MTIRIAVPGKGRPLEDVFERLAVATGEAGERASRLDRVTELFDASDTELAVQLRGARIPDREDKTERRYGERP